MQISVNGDAWRDPYDRGTVSDLVLLDARGYRRATATLPGFHAGRPPRNRGRRYHADPRRLTSSCDCCAAAAALPVASGCAR
jgi:hypothetical protein